MSEEYLQNPEVLHLQKLVKIETDSLRRNIRWLTKRLQQHIDESAGASVQPAGGPGGFAAVPPDSESALRDDGEQLWTGPDWTCSHCQYVNRAIRSICRNRFCRSPRPAKPAGGPPTPDLAAQPDSTTEERSIRRHSLDLAAYQSINRLERLNAQNAERQACINDIKAAFWGDEYITDRYDIAYFILDRIAKRQEKENA